MYLALEVIYLVILYYIIHKDVIQPFLDELNQHATVSLGGKKKSKTGVIVGTAGGLVGLLAVGCLLWYMYKGKHRGYRQEVYVDVSGMRVCFIIQEKVLIFLEANIVVG